jgi:hypothetical protein
MDSSDRSFEEEMLNIDVEAIAREFGDKSITTIEGAGPSRGMGTAEDYASQVPSKAEAIICKSTGKVQFKNALIAIAALKKWKMVDPSMCWGIQRMRVYKCKKCHEFHLGKSNGLT